MTSASPAVVQEDINAPLIVLDVKSLINKLHVSRTMIWQIRKEEDFPKPIRLTARRIAWLESEIDAWILSKANERENNIV